MVEETFTVVEDDSGISFAGCPSPDALGPVGAFWHDGDGKLNADYAGFTSLFAVGPHVQLDRIPDRRRQLRARRPRANGPRVLPQLTLPLPFPRCAS